MFNLQKHKAFISGSSRGIGRAVAMKLLEAGARVILHGTAMTPKLEEALAQAGPDAACLTADFNDAAAVEKLAEQLLQPEMNPDILVLNCSFQKYIGVSNFSHDEFDRMFRINLESNFLLLNRLLPSLKARQWGRIILVNSINGIRPAPRLSVYASTKAALLAFGDAVAKEYAPYGITVNSLVPGVICTDRNNEALKNQEFAESLMREIPAHRFGSAEECAAAAAFLASEEAAYVTGSRIHISGGWQL